nr:hypothetical protein [Tanacetum cinerariifolium]
MNQQCEQEALLVAQREQELLIQNQAAQEKEEPPQNSNFRQLIEEICGTKVREKQKQNMEDTMLELLEESLQNFKVIHKMSSISNTTLISSVITIVPVLPTEEPEYSLSMGDEHLSTIPETESDKVIKSSVEILVPIPSESEVTSDNDNILIDSSPKFDFILEEFSGELAHIDPIPPGIEKADLDLEEEIRLIENLFDSQMEEIDLFLATDDLMPPGIENDDYDSEGDIHFLEELISDDHLSLPENESSNFDHHNDPSFPRPPPEPSDDEIFFDFDPDTGVLIAKVVEDISEHYVLMPKALPSQPTLCPNIDTLLPFLSENEDKVFNPGILSYLLVSHRDKIISNFFEIPMMMYGGDIPLLDVSFLHFYPP